MNVLLVYRGITDGQIVVSNLNDSKEYENSELFVHIGTVHPQSFLQFLLNVEDDLADKYFKK